MWKSVGAEDEKWITVGFNFIRRVKLRGRWSPKEKQLVVGFTALNLRHQRPGLGVRDGIGTGVNLSDDGPDFTNDLHQKVLVLQ